MRKLLQVTLNELLVTFAERAIWINLVLIPVALVFIIGIVSGGSNPSEGERVRVDVIDADGSELSARFMDVLRRVNPVLRLCPFDTAIDTSGEDFCGLGDDALTQELANDRLERNRTNAVITIPAGFGDSLLNGEPVQVGYLSNQDITQVDPLLQAVEAAVVRVGGASVAAQVMALSLGDTVDEDQALVQAVYDAAAERWQVPPIKVETVTAGEDEGVVRSGFSQSTPGIGTMYVMFTVLAGAVIMLRERKQWTMQRLITMPVSRAQLLGGKVLARFVMGMIQYGIAFAAGYLMGAYFGTSVAGLILIMVSFTICVTALAFLLASFVDREEQAASLTTFVVLILAPLGGAWWPLEIVPEFMRKLSYISPIGWAMNGFNELMVYNGTFRDVLPHAGVLLAAAAVLFVFGVQRFKYE